MKERVEFISRVYPKSKIDSVLDRSFKEFGQREEISSEKSVEQFFLDYGDLFYQIPATGDVNSHQYLVERSSEMYKLEGSLQDIQPLLDEITLLRSQSVEDQKTIIDLRLEIQKLNNEIGETGK